MNAMDRLVSGYRKFHQKYFVENDDVYKKLAEGQSPRVAMIACSDSRVDPSIIMDAEPGEIFVIRNVANLAPPYQPDGKTYHGTSAALEFAVNRLEVEHIIIFGHSKCAGIRSLLESESTESDEPSFINAWMQIAGGVKQEINHIHSSLPIEEKAHLCERKAIEHSLENLTTFPWIVDKINADTLALHGWHFDLETGTLWQFAPTDNSWEKLA